MSISSRNGEHDENGDYEYVSTPHMVHALDREPKHHCLMIKNPSHLNLFYSSHCTV